MHPLVSVVNRRPTMLPWSLSGVLCFSVECLGSVCLGKEDLAYVTS